MPNWCSNHLNLYGSKEEIKKITDILNANLKYEEDGVVKYGGMFESLVGKDPNVSEEEYNAGAWYDSNCEYWGCKWDVTIKEAYIDFEEEEIRLSFDTPWSPPFSFYKELAKKFNIYLNAIYDEPGLDFAGEINIDEEGNVDNREYKYLEGIYHRGDDIFWDEVRSQLDYMLEEYDKPVTYEYVAEWLHFVEDAELYDFIMEYEDKLVK